MFTGLPTPGASFGASTVIFAGEIAQVTLHGSHEFRAAHALVERYGRAADQLWVSLFCKRRCKKLEGRVDRGPPAT
jgi:hypothetical protein